MREQNEAHRSRSLRLLLFATSVAGLAGLVAANIPAVSPRLASLPWLALVVAIFSADATTFRIEFQRDALVFSVSTVAFVVALFTLSPAAVIGAWIAATLLFAVAVERVPVTKRVVNLAGTWLGVAVGVYLFAALGGPADPSPSAWFVSLVSMLAFDRVTSANVSLAVRIAGRRSEGFSLRSSFAGVVMTLVDTSLGLLVVTLIVHAPWALIPLAVVSLLLVSAYKAYERLLLRMRELHVLHSFSESLSTAVVDDRLLPTLVERARELLHAEQVIVVVPTSDGVAWLSSEDPTAIVPISDPEDPRLGLHQWCTENPAEVWHLVPETDAYALGQLGADEILATAFPVDKERAATLAVFDRRGDVRGFTDEDKELVATVAGNAGVSVQNGFLVEQLRAEALDKEHQSLHDPLTGLPNRTLFRQSLEEKLRSEPRLAVVLIDLDGFKEVNDTLGHHHGDELLTEIGTRLSETIGEGRMVARLGGDEFALLLPGADADEARQVASDVAEALKRQIVLADLPIEVGASIGVALAPLHSDDASTLMRYADIAMYVAKLDLTGIEVYSPTRDETSTDRLALMGELRNAIDQGTLEVYLQPQLDLVTDEVIGAEALVRWKHPRHGWVPPDDFIAIAERTGVIHDLTQLVLAKSLDECVRWRARGHDLAVSVNLSPRDLLEERLVETVMGMLRERHLPPESLCLELTESGIMGDRLRSVAVLRRLRAAGIALAIDDFGQGHSSLAYLGQLPMHEVKIDKEFVRTFTHNSQVIVQAVVNIAEAFNFKVVAEGIEEASTVDRLVNLGCRYGQGFFFAKPLPPDEFLDWLEAWIAAHAEVASA